MRIQGTDFSSKIFHFQARSFIPVPFPLLVMNPLPEFLVTPHNHFDPTWRRCFDRPADYNGVRVRSYAEIEDLVLTRSLELSDKGYTQSEGQTLVWRKYLERHPKALTKLREEIRAGRLCIMMAGETVQDSVLPSAEGLVRNFLVAMPDYRQWCGEDHEGLKIGWLEDTFGSGPNYPQILKGVGVETAWGTRYRPCPEEVFIGIDGTKITCMDHVAHAGIFSFMKYPPCPECKGYGCQACDQTGMQLIPELTKTLVSTKLEALIEAFLSFGAKPQETLPTTGERLDTMIQEDSVHTAAPKPFIIGGEESIVEKEVADAVLEIAQKYRDKIRVRFATSADVYRRERERLNRQLAACKNETPHDLNPAMPGCYVTRIKTKQRTRAVAYLLTSAESKLANEAWAANQPMVQPADLNLAWQRVAFGQFHDAITGTLIDSAYEEMMDFLDEAEQLARRHLPAPQAASLPQFTVAPAQPQEVTWGHFKIRFDLKGITEILSDGRNLFEPFATIEGFDMCRIGELALESDFGDPWGQRIRPTGDLVKNYSRRGLGEFHERMEVSERAIRWHGVYCGGHKKVKQLAWNTRVELSEDGQRLNFITEVDWDTESKRLRVLFPVASQEPTATYEVPFGFIDRKYDATLLDYSQWKADHREFAIQNWAHKKIDANAGVALLVKGLPCVRWAPGLLDLSLVRSTEWEFCIVEPVFYEFWDTDGHRDTGHHRFEYSLWPHAQEITTTQLTREGLRYNQPEFQAPPFKIEGEVAVTAWKPAENGEGWILRLQETRGEGTDIGIEFGQRAQVTPCDLLERAQGHPAAPSLRWQGSLHRHGILTLRIQKE